MRLDVEVFGDVQLAREIVRVGDRAGNLSPVFESLMDRLREINDEQFRSRGARGGDPWDPLKPATILEKARLGAPEPTFTLYRWGNLYTALAAHSDENQEVIITDDWAVFRVTGEPGEIGMYHHWGAPGANLPERPLIRLTEEDRREFVREVEHYLFTGDVRQFL